MKIIINVLQLILTSLRRLLVYKSTALAALLGLTLAITLILGISMYADGIYYQTFLDNVAKTRENKENQLLDGFLSRKKQILSEVSKVKQKQLDLFMKKGRE